MIQQSDPDRIVGRITSESGVPELFDVLAERISPTDLQSLLIAVYRRRASNRTPGDVVRQYSTNRYVQPSGVSPVKAAALDQLAFSLLPNGYQPIELSPLSPFGSCSALGPVDQNRIISTTRNTEVCSDPTNVLALEAAARRATNAVGDRDQLTRLCASQRVIRTQEIQGSASFPHFRVLTLCTAGRTVGNLALEEDAVLEHARFYVTLLDRSMSLGYHVSSIRIVLLALSEKARNRVASLSDRLASELSTAGHSGATIETSADTEVQHYYQDYRVQIYATTELDQEYFLVDGGLVPWTSVLLNNRKEFCMTSGMGTERFVAMWSSGGE